MRFVRPRFKGHHVMVAENQEPYLPVPALIVAGKAEAPSHLLAIEFDLHERLAIAEGSLVYLNLLTFGGAMTPLRVTVGEWNPQHWFQLELDL